MQYSERYTQQMMTNRDSREPQQDCSLVMRLVESDACHVVLQKLCVYPSLKCL